MNDTVESDIYGIPNVYLVKLVTGEEVLCTVTHGGKVGLQLKDCLAVVVQPGDTDPKTGKTRMGFGFIPWATMAKNGVFIEFSKILYHAEPEDEILDHYNKLFGHTQIQVPPKGLVIAR